MDAQATFSVSVPQCIPVLTSGPLASAPPQTESSVWPAQQLQPHQRQELVIAALAGTETISELARQHQVSRKFLHGQIHTAEQALEQAFAPRRPSDDVLFHLPVTKAWIEQLVLALVLICHSSDRGVVELLEDLFDYPLSVGTVHNIVHGAVAPARRWNQQYDLSTIKVGADDEIFQGDVPVLVGVDTATTFCYLLSLEEQCDTETWGVRLLELTDRGFAPQAIVCDAGKCLRAGQALAMPGTPCRGDVFHALHEGQEVASFLERRAYKAIENCKPLPLKQAGRGGRPPLKQASSVADQQEQYQRAQVERDAAVQLYDDIAVLLSWLRHDVLAVAGPGVAERRQLYDFVVAELEARVPRCSHRLHPFWRMLKNQRDALLEFARSLDEGLGQLAEEFAVAPDVIRRVLVASSRDDRDPRRWSEEQRLREELRGRFREVWEAVMSLGRGTVRASSLVENLNSRLRNYFFLRRQLGADYLSLLQFFLNHRPLRRSRRPERVGRSPAELLTGQAHLHWLSLLGYTRFSRS
jgi:hypothetical protein